VAWNYSWEGRVMKKLLDDQKRLDQLIAEALVSHLEPKAAVAEFIAFLFLQ
jgi:hypothetical protein